jgi:(S)-mandelate dehydrogenase
LSSYFGTQQHHGIRSRLDWCYDIEDLRRIAKRRLPKGIFQFVDGGTEDWIARDRNREAFERLRLRTRALVDMSDRDLGTELFGSRIELPLGISPTGVAGLCWLHGELALAKAAAKAGIPFTLATGSITSMETVAQAGGRLWFQLYLWEERNLSYEMVDRAASLGYEALVVTVDQALGYLPNHNDRNGFSFPFRPNARALTQMLRKPRWLVNVLLRTILATGTPKNLNYPPQYQRMVTWRNDAPKPRWPQDMTWADIDRLRERWPGRLIVKGVLDAHDARLAVEHGADAVIVSNHGGRTMDSAITTIEVLPEVVAEVGDRTTVILDSGIRRGSDMVKALALGADMVMVGRPTLYGLAAKGQDGADKAIGILALEFERYLGYLGCRHVGELGPEIFARPSV